MKRIFAGLVMMVVAVVMSGCAGTNFVKQTDLDGFTVVQGGRTGAFGTDNSFVAVVPKPAPAAQVVVPNVPQVLTLKKTYSKSVTKWDNCSSKKPNKNAKHIKREEQEETETQEVLNPAAAPIVPAQQATPAPMFWAGGNPSTGNVMMPALMEAAGIAGGAALLRPGHTTVSNGSNSEVNDSGNSRSTSNSNSESYAKASAENKTRVGVGVNTNVGVNTKGDTCDRRRK